jgi:predicted membrane protein
MNEMAGVYLSECFSSVMLWSICVGLFLVGAKLERVWKRAVCCAQLVIVYHTYVFQVKC